MKINFHRVLLGFFENWDKSPQKKWDKGELETCLTAPKDGEYTIFRYNDFWGEVFVNGEKIGSFQGPEIKPCVMKLKLRKGLNVLRHRTRAGSGGNWKCAFLIPTDSPLKESLIKK